jgi:hypothetical protein
MTENTPNNSISIVQQTNNQLSTWDFRQNAEGLTYTDIIKNLEGIAKHYVFQLEEGDGGYRHYQGRISLIKKRRITERHLLLKLFKKPPQYLQPTVNAEHYKGEAFYCLKEDTRIEGPWKDTDIVKVLTKQLQLFTVMDYRPYQESLLKMATVFDMRKIDLIYDPNGNIGKSLFAEHLEYLGIAEEIPPFRLMDDIFQWVATRPIKPCYLVDMPRGMKKDRLGDFYSGIEVIKNGVAYDKRYKAHKVRFNRPRVFVFTNVLPQLSLMSKDRWNIWIVNNAFELEIYNIAQIYNDGENYSENESEGET